jgi:hypothetical protein
MVDSFDWIWIYNPSFESVGPRVNENVSPDSSTVIQVIRPFDESKVRDSPGIIRPPAA